MSVTRYAARSCRWRDPPGPTPPPASTRASEKPSPDTSAPSSLRGGLAAINQRIDWASLLKRVYQIDLLRCRCGGTLRAGRPRRTARPALLRSPADLPFSSGARRGSHPTLRIGSVIAPGPMALSSHRPSLLSRLPRRRRYVLTTDTVVSTSSVGPCARCDQPNWSAYAHFRSEAKHDIFGALC